MIARLWTVASPTCYKDTSVLCLNWTESYRDVELNVKNLSRLFIILNVVESEHPLVKLKEVYPVCLALIRCRSKPVELHLSGITETSDTPSSWISSCSPHKQWILSITTCESHTLTQHFRTCTIHVSQYTVTVFSELWMLLLLLLDYRWILAIVTFLDILLKEYSLQFDVAIV